MGMFALPSPMSHVTSTALTQAQARLIFGLGLLKSYSESSHSYYTI